MFFLRLAFAHEGVILLVLYMQRERGERGGDRETDRQRKKPTSSNGCGEFM